MILKLNLLIKNEIEKKIRCTVDGSITEQNAITSNTCNADTMKNISRELGDTGHI